jgi:hypothetical protein
MQGLADGLGLGVEADALLVRRAISSTAAVVPAAAAAAQNCSASIASSFGIKVPPKRRARLSGKAPPEPKK